MGSSDYKRDKYLGRIHGKLGISRDDGIIIKLMVDGDDLIFQQVDGDEVLRLKDNKNVGIGGDPSTTLHVQAVDPRVRVDATVGDHPGFELSEAGARKWIMYNQPDGGADSLIFKSSADRLTITQDGTVILEDLQIGSFKRILAVDQIIRFADSGDNTVIVEVDIKIPAKAIITRVSAMVKTLSNLSTHEVNIQMSATSGTGADSSISSGTELLGAGAEDTISTDSGGEATDISLGTSASDLKDVWINSAEVLVGTSDQYIYICNSGTGNGTTNSSAGTLSVVVEYYGMD